MRYDRLLLCSFLVFPLPPLQIGFVEGSRSLEPSEDEFGRGEFDGESLCRFGQGALPVDYFLY